MKPARRLNRRSFLGQVAGGAATVGALGLIGGSARAQTGPYTGVTDTDSGSHADNAGHGRGPGGNASGNPQGVTDSDVSDPHGGGRGGSTGYSDSDSGANADPSGRGRRGQSLQTGVTDSDSYDRYGEGRGPAAGGVRNNFASRPDGTRVEYTGITDTDSGATRDPANYGRGTRECRDRDVESPDWNKRDPVRRCE